MLSMQYKWLVMVFAMVTSFFLLTGMIASSEIWPATLYFIFLLFILLNIFFSFKYGVRFSLYVLLIIIPFQPFMTMPFVMYLSPLDLKIIVALKEIIMMYMFAIVATFLVRNKFFIIDYLALLFAALYFVSLLKSGISFVTLVSFREGFMLVLMYFLGRALTLAGISISEFVRAVFLISIVVVLFGYLERFIIGDWFWQEWGAVDYLNAKFSESSMYVQSYGGIPQNWYTYVGNESIRRMAATIGDAASFGRYAAFSAVAFLYFKSLRTIPLSKYFWILIILAVILTFGRGGMLLVIIGLGVWLLQFKKIWIITTPLLIAVAVLLTYLPIFDVDSGNSQRHITGLTDGLSVLFADPIGHGLGSSGQMALLYSEGDSEQVGESYIGSLSYQLGIPGFLLFSIWMLYSVYILIKIHRKTRPINDDGDKELLFSASLLIGIYITSFFANSAVAPISSFATFIVFGMVVTRFLNKGRSTGSIMPHTKSEATIDDEVGVVAKPAEARSTQQ